MAISRKSGFSHELPASPPANQRNYKWFRPDGDDDDSFGRGIIWGAAISFLLWGGMALAWLTILR